MYIIYNAWHKNNFPKFHFTWWIILQKLKLFKKNKRKTEHANNDVTRQDPANVSASDLILYTDVWELNLQNAVGVGAGDRLGERDAIIVQASDGTQTDNVGIFFLEVKGIRLAVLLLEFHSTFSEPSKIWRF